MKRSIITIDEDLCNGCGDCVTGCPEGALQLIDGKARLVNDLFCDGLGACIGECPVGAITIEEREAVPYDERQTMENIIKAGPNTIRAHLEHLASHGETVYHAQALEVLREKGVPVPGPAAPAAGHGGGCPGSRSMNFGPAAAAGKTAAPADSASALTQWPVQMHLLNPAAPHFAKADFLLAADCTAFALGGFHGSLLSGKKLGIACPKLDDAQDSYLDKLVALIDQAQINTLTVAVMEVPCCGGLLRLAEAARAKASRAIPLKKLVVGIQGDVLSEAWV